MEPEDASPPLLEVEQEAAPARTVSRMRHRGKLYALGDDSTWQDFGTGFATVDCHGSDTRLVFRDEESDRVVHDRPVCANGEVYQLQGHGDRRTIIVWEDPGTSKDWALSFQDPEGTRAIYEDLIGGKAPDAWNPRAAPATPLSPVPKSPQNVVVKRILPLPKLQNLADLGRFLSGVPLGQRDIIASEVGQPEWITELRESFRIAQELQNEVALGSLWHIVKGIFLLSSPKLTERYLMEDMYHDTFGMLEFDVFLPASKRIPHRSVLSSSVRWKRIVEFRDEESVRRIHLGYRLQYLRDIILPRILDDSALMVLSHMIFMNVTRILCDIQKNDEVLGLIIAQLRQGDLQALSFVLEMCRLARQIPPSERSALYDKMYKHKLFDALLPMYSGDIAPEQRPSPKESAVEVLLLSCANDPWELRVHVTSPRNVTGRQLLTNIINMMQHSEDQGVQQQMFEILKMVMDVSAIDLKEQSNYVDVFYSEGAMEELMQVVRSELNPEEKSCDLYGRQLAVELLSFAVVSHGHWCKMYILRSGIAADVAKLCQCPHRFLQLSPVRFLAAVVRSKDEVYHRHLISRGFLANVFEAFVQSAQPPASGWNLVISVILDVLENIRIENIKVLIDHVVQKHEATLKSLAPKYKVFRNLLHRHEKNLELQAFPPDRFSAGAPSSQEVPNKRPRLAAHLLGHEDCGSEDESYFENLGDLDDDDEVAPADVSFSNAQIVNGTTVNFGPLLSPTAVEAAHAER